VRLRLNFQFTYVQYCISNTHKPRLKMHVVPFTVRIISSAVLLRARACVCVCVFCFWFIVYVELNLLPYASSINVQIFIKNRQKVSSRVFAKLRHDSSRQFVAMLAMLATNGPRENIDISRRNFAKLPSGSVTSARIVQDSSWPHFFNFSLYKKTTR